MHFCKFNLVFVGIGYKPSPNNSKFGFITFELYRCRKCGKLIFKNEVEYEEVSRQFYHQKLSEIKSYGYKTLGELINNSFTLKEENKCVLNLVK